MSLSICPFEFCGKFETVSSSFGKFTAVCRGQCDPPSFDHDVVAHARRQFPHGTLSRKPSMSGGPRQAFVRFICCTAGHIVFSQQRSNFALILGKIRECHGGAHSPSCCLWLPCTPTPKMNTPQKPHSHGSHLKRVPSRKAGGDP